MTVANEQVRVSDISYAKGRDLVGDERDMVVSFLSSGFAKVHPFQISVLVDPTTDENEAVSKGRGILANVLNKVVLALGQMEERA